MTQKTYIRNYRGRIIELHQSDAGWTATFRKFAHVIVTDIGEPFLTQKETIAHAKRYVDWEVQGEEIAEKFEALFDELVKERYPVALIFDALGTAAENRGWAEQVDFMDQAVAVSPGRIR